MKNAFEVIIAPVISEKTMKLSGEGKYTFEVHSKAGKIEIAKAVEEIFNVKVEKVNVLNVRPRTKRMGKYMGKTSAVRKAIVKLAEGQEIDLFGTND
jgi:large subunit ribosomal protein L23